ncbi:hypothetical protein ACFQT0_21555 [Hymenobacter humi]|uniref:CsbD family protein n=1 Tax=Hymenobacter humi TaxID=1411620 RepID=A0ABW2U9U4_9BACT
MGGGPRKLLHHIGGVERAQGRLQGGRRLARAELHHEAAGYGRGPGNGSRRPNQPN